MLIDEERLFTLTKFVSTKGVINQTKSDHNVMFCNFDLTYKKEVQTKVRREFFNLKNVECQEAFKEDTDNSTKFTDIFEKEATFEEKTYKFNRCLNQSIRKCFKKVRVNPKVRETEISQQLKLWSKLKIFLKTSKCEKSLKKAEKQFKKLDESIQRM